MDIVERFLAYTQINTTTDREKGAIGIMPSSSGQMVLAKHLEQELLALGLKDVQVSERAIVTATLLANTNGYQCRTKSRYQSKNCDAYK